MVLDTRLYACASYSENRGLLECSCDERIDIVLLRHCLDQVTYFLLYNDNLLQDIVLLP